jgi:hypothetical protein
MTHMAARKTIKKDPSAAAAASAEGPEDAPVAVAESKAKAPAAEPAALAQAAKPPPLVENLMAPEVFASEAFSISLVQGMISIAFTSPRYDYSETPSVMKKVVVNRLVIPPAGALSMAVRLFALLDKHGLGAAPKDPQARQ